MASTTQLPSPIHLDGTTLEGGGQLLRLALGLSSLTKKPIHINKIRGKRSGGGGLKAQHLTCVQWLCQASYADITGAEIKSKEITFTPSNAVVSTTGVLKNGKVRIKQTTPGSVNLVLQAILPYIIFSGVESPIRVRIDGGTNVSNSPSIDYVIQVLIPMLKRIGIPHIDIELDKRGWSQGSSTVGSVTFKITPMRDRLLSFQLLNRGDIVGITATIIAPKDTERQFREELDVMFEHRQARLFGDTADLDDSVQITFEDSHHDKRYYLLLVATTSTGMKLGRDWLYDRGFRAGKLEQIIPTMVKKVSDDLLAEIEHGGCADEYLRDQLVVYQALAQGRSQVYGGQRKDVLVEPSLHARTAQWVAKEILGVEFDDEGGCEGVGYLSSGLRKDDVVGDDVAKDLEKMKISS
jgi:RNA 3'-terminal phosphate cyclase (ATP)